MATPYNVLSICATASPADVRSAYRAASLLHHPDKDGDPSCFRLVKGAYDILGDPIVRHGWDQLDAAIYERWVKVCEHEGVKAIAKGSCGATKRPKKKQTNQPRREAETASDMPWGEQADRKRPKWPQQERPKKKEKQAPNEQQQRETPPKLKPNRRAQQSKPSKRNPANPFAWSPYEGDPFTSTDPAPEGIPVNVVPDDHPFAKSVEEQGKDMSPKAVRQRAKDKERRAASSRKEGKKRHEAYQKTKN